MLPRSSHSTLHYPSAEIMVMCVAPPSSMILSSAEKFSISTTAYVLRANRKCASMLRWQLTRSASDRIAQCRLLSTSTKDLTTAELSQPIPQATATASRPLSSKDSTLAVGGPIASSGGASETGRDDISSSSGDASTSLASSESDRLFLQTAPRWVGTVTRTGSMVKTVRVTYNEQRFDKFLQKNYTKPARALVHDPEQTLVEGDVIEYGLFPPTEQQLRKDKGRGKCVKYVVRGVVTPFGTPLDQRVPKRGFATLSHRTSTGLILNRIQGSGRGFSTSAGKSAQGTAEKQPANRLRQDLLDPDQQVRFLLDLPADSKLVLTQRLLHVLDHLNREALWISGQLDRHQRKKRWSKTVLREPTNLPPSSSSQREPYKEIHRILRLPKSKTLIGLIHRFHETLGILRTETQHIVSELAFHARQRGLSMWRRPPESCDISKYSVREISRDLFFSNRNIAEIWVEVDRMRGLGDSSTGTLTWEELQRVLWRIARPTFVDRKELSGILNKSRRPEPALRRKGQSHEFGNRSSVVDLSQFR